MENASIISAPQQRNGSESQAYSTSPGTNAAKEQILLTLLNQVQRKLTMREFDPDTATAAVDLLFHGLRDLRLGTSEDHWNDLVRIGREHPLRELVHQDPFTRRAYEKPRGYAGDAVMMDYIYGQEEDWRLPSATELGKAIFSYTTGAPASAGVRERRCYVADLLDRLGQQKPNAEILSVAAGHLREAGLSRAVRRKMFGRFVALDTDQESVKEISQRYGRYGIQPVVANARQMIAGQLDLGKFDLVYSTGLYDYLADDTAKRLTRNLFDSLRAGGKVVVANFLPGVRDVGYMEMYMGWHLIYRDRTQMMALADSILAKQIEEIRIVAERNENVVILEITKR